jgi:leader peptidase (prepilin peptidase) / N-methyltransferase
MPLIDMLVLFIFGTMIGSFINALAFRFNTGKSMWGRSACLSCGATLKAQHLVPMLSYAWQRGKCAWCRSRISVQYPIVEVLAGLIAVLAWSATGTPGLYVAVLAYFQSLLFIAVYDIRHTIIPDAFVYASALIGLGMHGYLMGIEGAMWAVASGLIIAAPLFVLWLISKGAWVGLGDAKLLFSVGAFLGLLPGVAAFLIAFWVGALFGLALIATSRLLPRLKGVTMKSELPFGPYIVLSSAVVYFCGLSLYDLLIYW